MESNQAPSVRVYQGIRSNVVGIAALFVALGGVAAANVPDNSVGGAKIKPNVIRPIHLKPRTMANENIRPGAIKPNVISDGAIITPKIRDDAVDGSKVADDSLTGADIDESTLQGLGSPSGAAGGDLAGSYPDPTIAGGAVGSAKVADDSLTGADIDESTLQGVTPAGAAGGDLAGTYPDPTIGPDAIGSAEIADGSITGADVEADSLGADEIDESGLGLAQGALLGRINGLSGAATEFGTISGTSDATATESDVTFISTHDPMTLTGFRAFIPGGVGAGESRTFTVREQGADTAISCTVPTGSFGCTDTVNSESFQFGSTMSVKVETTGAPAPQDALISIRALAG